MSVGLVMRFSSTRSDQYDAVMQELGLPLGQDDNPNWPDGIISHIAGQSPNGWCVVDVWESQEKFDRFLANRLGPALHKAGIEEQPEVTPFEVYNIYRHGR